MLEVYLVLGILGLLYAKSSKNKGERTFHRLCKRPKKRRRSYKITKSKNVFPNEDRTNDDTDIIGLTGRSISKESF